jgi:hypothetical protein
LLALAQHLGHRERAITDQGYAGSDYRLNREIESEILEQSVAAWEHMLAAPGLRGRAGVEIVAKRPRFRGMRLKQEIKSYARLLVDSGPVLGVRLGIPRPSQEHSACLGNAVGLIPHGASHRRARAAEFCGVRTTPALLGREQVRQRGFAQRTGVANPNPAHPKRLNEAL